MNYADEAEAALAKTREEGSFSVLPGMNNNDFDYCQCGLGWPMGHHHAINCPAHCFCGMCYIGSSKRGVCSYHAGTSGKIPVGPSVMTERWDLKPDLPEEEREKRDGVGQKLAHRLGGEIQESRAGEKESRETPLS